MSISLIISVISLLSAQQIPQGQDVGVEPIDLEDIVVIGRPLKATTERFIRSVGDPVRDRGLARWRRGICVGAVNFSTEVGQAIVDRVSDVARDVGLSAGAPGCTPTILIIGTVNGNAFAEQYVAARPRMFQPGGAGMDQGNAALQNFERVERPVRWWHVSMPVNDETGENASRLPGLVNGAGVVTGDTSAQQYGPTMAITTASRLTTQVVDDLKKAFVIVDVHRLGNTDLSQLADYVAFIVLAQVNPDADTSGYATILNVFDDPAGTPALTNWDKAYLAGLYESDRTRANLRSHQEEIAASILRAHARLSREREE